MYTLRISKIIPQPNNNITFQLESIAGDYPSYKAGQFITLSFVFGDREVRRSYSFNSSPDNNEPLSITVKRVENGEISSTAPPYYCGGGYRECNGTSGFICI
jgi:ring-1,2-phenylacetyl-CoA epoxidase subunit PaaE